MVMRLLVLTAFLLILMVAASAAAQTCGDVPATVIEYVGFNPDDAEDERDNLATAVGQLIARFSLRCGYRLVLNVRRRSGGYEVTPNAITIANGCEYWLRVRDGTRTRAGRSTRLADAITEVADLGVSITPRDRPCADP